MTDRLTPARKAVLLGLLEGRIKRLTDMAPDVADAFADAMWAEECVLLEDESGFKFTPALTPAGRTLAERLAKEGR